MKNDMKGKQNSSNTPMPWPKNNDKQKNRQTGNNTPIGNDPATAGNSGSNLDNDPEINSPIYDPEKTEKKIPVMKDSEKPG